jgi:hypothetical protein
MALHHELKGVWRSLADGVFAFFVGLMALWSLARRFPLQNVAIIGLIVISLSALATVIFAHALYFTFNDEFGPSVLVSNGKRLLPWQVPFLALALTVTSRETARLVLRPWRRQKNYGLWLLGTASLLVVLLSLHVEPFAAGLGQWWTWAGNPASMSWLGVPWVAFAAWFCLSGLVLGFASPWFIVKRPLALVPDLTPVALWGLILTYFAVGNALGRNWPPVGTALAALGLVGFLAWRGWRSSQPPITPPPGTASPNATA